MNSRPEHSWLIAPPQTPQVPVAGGGRFPVRRIYCVGRNYRAHALEMGDSLPEPPFFFAKPADAVSTERVIPYPSMTENLHHEGELVVAISGTGRSVAVDQANAMIFGYAAGVDLTRRDLQATAKKQGRPWTMAKGFDCSAPLSPIRRAHDVGSADKLGITLSVNGETRQAGNTREMTWSVAEVISELSRFVCLKAGDLIFTGTPSGVGALHAGDQLVCAIERVGTVEFGIGPAA